MIVDEIIGRRLCLRGPLWDLAFEFLATLDGESEEGRFALQGDDVYAMVESYDTRIPKIALPEAHRVYTDIQVLLSGRERIDWWPTPGLTISKPYDSGKDIAFYERPEAPATGVVLVPGRFAVFFPADAHMPGLQAGSGPERVKKAVIKIRRPHGEG